MASIEKKKVYPSANRGLVNKLSATILRDNEAKVFDNCSINETGILRKAKGYIKDHSPFPDDPDSFIRMLLNFRRGTSIDVLLMASLDDGNANADYKVDLKQTNGDGTSDYLGHTTGTAVVLTASDTTVTGVGTLWLTGGGSTPILKAGDKFKRAGDGDDKYVEILTVDGNTQLTLASSYTGTLDGGQTDYTARIILHKDFLPSGAVFADKAIITNGSDLPMSYNGTTLDTIPDNDAPKARYVEPHKNRLFMASTTSSRSRVYWSNVNDPDVWEADSFEDIYPQDNGFIVGIKSFGDGLIVFKNNGKVYQIIGNFDRSAEGEAEFIRRVDVPENIGIIAERTPVIHGGFLYFLAEAGIYRIDQRMFTQFVSEKIDPFTQNVAFSFGGQSETSFRLSTISDFTAGTHSGTRPTSLGNESIFDAHSITSADQSSTGYAVAVDSSHGVHVVYKDSTNPKILKYKTWDRDNTVTSETIATLTTEPTNLTIDVAPSGDVIVACSRVDGGGLVEVKAFERTIGSWSAEDTVHAPGGALGTPSVGSISVKFRSDGNIRLVYLLVASGFTNGAVIYYGQRNGGFGSWAGALPTVGTETASSSTRMHLFLDSSNNPHLAYLNSSTEIRYEESTDDFATNGDRRTIAVSNVSAMSAPFIGVDSGGDVFVTYSNNSHITKYDVTNSTSSNLVTGVPDYNHLVGYHLDPTDDKDQWVHIGQSDKKEVVTYEDSETVTSATSETDTDLLPGSDSYASNGTVGVWIVKGLNADELVVRRVAYRAKYISTEFFDNDLSAWGTYDIVESKNGNEVVYKYSTNSTSPVTPGGDPTTTVTDGQTIVASPTDNYIETSIDYKFNSWSIAQTDSITMNYTGTGINTRQPIAISFKNDMFLAVSEEGESANNSVLHTDIAGAFVRRTFPVYSMEAYKGRLYAGKATNGDLLILDNGYSYDDTAYDMDFQAKEDFLESIELEKDVYKFYVLYEVKSSGTFDFSYRLDNFATDSEGAWTTVEVDHTKDGFVEIPVGNKCRSIQYRISNDESDTQVGVIAVVLVHGFLNAR